MPKTPSRSYDPARAERERQARLERARLDKAVRAAETERAEALDPARWGVAAAALALPAHAEVEARRDGRGRIAHAHRTDVFERLHARGGLSDTELAAARRLARDMALRAGLLRPPSDLVKVDAQARTEGATQRMLEAGRRVDTALAAAGPGSARLLRAVVEPAATTASAGEDWRAAVARETGETNPHAQAARLRAACENLALAYLALDRGRRAKSEQSGNLANVADTSLV
jgi:hypothetical protein